MNCPPEIAAILLDILSMAALRIRALGGAGNARRCAIEADHIHNLPALLQDYSPELLRYYWEAERPGFISQSTPADLAGFQPLWAQLAIHIPGPANQARIG